MDYITLLDLSVEIGYCLAMNGAETFRIEESITRILAAYGITAEAFAIPNCLHVSIETEDNGPMTRMRRIGYHGSDLDAVEKYSNLSRKICTQKPDPKTAQEWLQETTASLRHYPLYLNILGGFLGGFGFGILFGGNYIDALCAGLCGIIICLVNHYLDRFKANTFFRTILASFTMAIAAYCLGYTGVANNTDAVTIGALMILVPGLMFTNAMRDIIYGDTNSGINRIVQVFLVAVAIALGTGAAWKAVSLLLGSPLPAPAISHSYWIELIAAFVGCCGFFILFNIHGPGGFICALGGTLTWLAYRLVKEYSGDDILAYFIATMLASLYSEIMARIRKYPAISYLVVSAFPLIPGAGVYYTMNYTLTGDMENFVNQGMHTIAIAGVMAVGILMISTLFRFTTLIKQQRNSPK